MVSTSTWMQGPTRLTARCWQESSKELQQRGIFKTSFSSHSNCSRKWKIKVGQIPCDSVTNPRFGCLQYHTATTGTVNVPQNLDLSRLKRIVQVRSFNFLADSGSYLHLANQFYRVCVRRAEKYCTIAWSQCSDTDSFKVRIYVNIKYVSKYFP